MSNHYPVTGDDPIAFVLAGILLLVIIGFAGGFWWLILEDIRS